MLLFIRDLFLRYDIKEVKEGREKHKHVFTFIHAHPVAVAVVVECEGRVALSEVEDERLRLAHKKNGLRLRAVGFDLQTSRTRCTRNADSLRITERRMTRRTDSKQYSVHSTLISLPRSETGGRPEELTASKTRAMLIFYVEVNDDCPEGLGGKQNARDSDSLYRNERLLPPRTGSNAFGGIFSVGSSFFVGCPSRLRFDPSIPLQTDLIYYY